MATVLTYESEFSPNHQISLCLFRNVKNSNDLKQMLISGKINACFIKPAMIVSTFQVLAAANKALQNDMREKRVTRSLHAEVLFCLAPSKNITDAFKKFGIGQKDTEILVVEISDKTLSTMNTLIESIEGDARDVKELEELCDKTLVKKAYKITEDELNVGSLQEAVVCRIASKDFVSF